jgi:hypothetical protein
MPGTTFAGEKAACSTSAKYSAFSGDGRKAREHGRLLSDLRENRCLGVLRDVVSRREGSVRSPAFRMHPALGNDLAIEVGELLDQPDVLQ